VSKAKMNIKAIIRTYNGHPELSEQRVAWAIMLQKELADLNAMVYMDLRGDPYVHFLDILEGCFELDESVAGVLHIEDDAILCNNFIEKMQAEVEQHPEHVIQFFSKFDQDATSESGFHYRFVGGVCFYIPRALIKPIHRYVLNWHDRTLNPTAWDVAIGYMMREQKMFYWLVLPNLADHRVSQSIIDCNRQQDRRSNTFKIT